MAIPFQRFIMTFKKWKSNAKTFFLLIVLFFSSGSSSACFGLLQNDTIELFFENIEFLKWSDKNEEAVDILSVFLEKGNEDDIRILRAENELAENYRWLGDADSAFFHLEKVNKVYQKYTEINKIELIRNYLIKGKSFRLIDNYDSALIYDQKALDLARIALEPFHILMGDIWMELGYIHTSKFGDYTNGLKYNLNAQNVYNKSLRKEHIKLAVLYYALASNYRELGDFERTGIYARLAEIIYDSYGEIFLARKVSCRVVQGNCYFDDRNYKDAITIYSDVISKYEGELMNDRGNFVITLVNYGVSLFELKNYKNANRYIERSITINPKENRDDSLRLAYAYSYLGQIFEKLSKVKEAEEIFYKSLAINSQYLGQDHIDIILNHIYFGNYHENKGSYTNALYYYEKAMMAGMDKSEINSPLSKFEKIPKNLTFRLLFNKARVHNKIYIRDQNKSDLLAAYDLYKSAYQLIRKTANSNMMEESLLNIPENFHEDLNYGVDCALALYESTNDPLYLDQLLQFVETNKYFLLQNSIAKSKSKEILGIPDSVYQKERDLLQKINSLKQDINNTIFTNDDEEYEKRLALLHTTIQWENTRKLWNTSEDEHISITNINTSISIDSIKDHILDENDLLLEYFQTSDTLYTIAINKAQEKIIRLAKNPVLDTHLQNYISHLFYKDSFTSKTDFIKFVAAAQYLYTNLVRPATSKMDMDEADENSRLIIVPDTQFSNVPFEAFIIEPADTTYINYYGLHYLCKDFTIDYAYATNLLDNNLSDENKHGNEGILALSYSSTLEQSTLASRNDEYGELPYSAVELRNIRKWIRNGKFFDGEQATESIFKSNASNYDIIHLALHGIGDTLDMLNSHLIFKAPGNKIEDGFLYAHELYGMDLNGTELAVLSACETGVGKIMQGEGVYSLARGFAYAGCPSIVMSLWKVDDASTSELMNYFYKNLSRGMHKDEALKKAKIAFLNNTNDLGAHPANWAAFIALGNNEPIEFPSTIFKWYYWMVLIVIIGASIMVYRNIHSREIDSI